MDKEDIVKEMLKSIGEDPLRTGLKDTPGRVVKMWEETFRGYDLSAKPKLTTFPNNEDGLKYSQMIIDNGYYFSHCEHHLVPFFGQYHFGYIPGDKIIGLSKVARIVDYYAAKLQVQERLVKEIVDELEQTLEPRGIALIMRGRHLCKEMRGVKKIDGEMVTSDLRGSFRKHESTRMEFMQSIQLNKK